MYKWTNNEKSDFLNLFLYKNYSLDILWFWEENKQMKKNLGFLGLNEAKEQIVRWLF